MKEQERGWWVRRSQTVNVLLGLGFYVREILVTSYTNVEFLQCVDDLDLIPVKNSEELPNRWVIHGTYHSALACVKRQGLSRMARNHIHFSPYEPRDSRTISGLRGNVQVLIYIDVDRAIAGG